MVDVVEPRIRALLATCPTMPATVIAERVGWTRGMTVLSERVRELRPIFLPPDPASRTGYVAGEIAQHDFWFPDIELPVGFGQTRTGKQLPVLTMVWLFADAVRQADPDQARRGPVLRLVAASAAVGRGAQGAGLGRGGRGR